jgi:uncharacterized membrane protein YeiH
MYAIDLIGTFFFALSGGLQAVRHKLDLLGILVLAVLTGVGGGIIRDIVLGDHPPAVFQDELYLIVCLVAGLAVFIGAPRINPNWHLMRLADAIGLGVFAAAGAAKAATFGLGPIGVVMMAALTATGGGVVRDILVLQIPMVLQRDFYATATLAGAVVFLVSTAVGADTTLSVGSCVVVTTGLRMIAIRKGLRLPRAADLSGNDGPDD